MIFKAIFGTLVTGEESVDLRHSHCCRFQDFKLTLVCMAEENWYRCSAKLGISNPMGGARPQNPQKCGFPWAQILKDFQLPNIDFNHRGKPVGNP